MLKLKAIAIIAVIIAAMTTGTFTGTQDSVKYYPATEKTASVEKVQTKARDDNSTPVRHDVANAKTYQQSESQSTPQKTKPRVNKTNKSTETQTKTPEHIHDWEPVYSYTTIEDIGHELREICKGCGADITSWSTIEWNKHSDEHLLAGEPAGFYEKEVKVVTGVHEIKKITGYRCSCGATK